MKLKSYQREAVHFAMFRRNTLIADEMGLGKTIEAIGVFNSLSAAMPTMLVICPANLVLNWQKEIEHWATKMVFIATITSGKPVHLPENVWIISYNLLSKWREKIRERKWDLLVLDEAHYLKNPKSVRTREVFGYKKASPIFAKKKVALTGTPILNRPIELWPLAHAFDFSGVGANWYTFVHKYCAAHRKYVPTKKGRRMVLDCSGASNLGELNNKLRYFMIRRLKKDVLTELPSKIRQKILLPSDNSKAEIQEEKRALQAHKDKSNENTLADVIKARIAVAKKKLPHIIEHIRNVLEQEDKIIIFFYHHEIGDLLAEEFKDLNITKIDGRISMAERQENIERFQTNPECRLILGSISTAVGYSATAANVVVFTEIDWTPGNLHQAEDRPHRIGQQESVLIQYILMEDSVDSEMVDLLTGKTNVVNAVLD